MKCITVSITFWDFKVKSSYHYCDRDHLILDSFCFADRSCSVVTFGFTFEINNCRFLFENQDCRICVWLDCCCWYNHCFCCWRCSCCDRCCHHGSGGRSDRFFRLKSCGRCDRCSRGCCFCGCYDCCSRLACSCGDFLVTFEKVSSFSFGLIFTLYVKISKSFLF